MVQQYNSITVQNVRQYNGTTVQQYNSTTVQRYNSATVQWYNSVMVQQYSTSRLHTLSKQVAAWYLVKTLGKAVLETCSSAISFCYDYGMETYGYGIILTMIVTML